MRWDRGYESPNIEDRRDQAFSGGGGGIPIGGLLSLFSMFGWKGILVGLVLAAVLAGGGTCMGGRGCLGAGTPTQQTSNPVKATPQEDDLKHFVGYVFDDVQKSWAKQLHNYETTHLVLFRRGVQSACGTATTAVGPFYCPLDHKVYIDLSFYDELRERFGAPGDFAQAYVIAHELGHHVQNLEGKMKGGNRPADSVPIELQADCAAGAWAKDAEARGEIEMGDIDEALNAAAQIGDDTLQRKSQGYVQPETWTHGSSEQRSSSFKKGYRGGREACGL